MNFRRKLIKGLGASLIGFGAFRAIKTTNAAKEYNIQESDICRNDDTLLNHKPLNNDIKYDIAAYDSVIKMLNVGPNGSRFRYDPLLVEIDTGLRVLWKANTQGHNVEFIKGGVPEGVGKFKSKFNKDVEFKFDVPGIYAYWCTPHKGMGMIASVKAMQLAIKKAKNTGIASVAVKNSSHYGAAGYYARLALEHDMLGFSMSSGGGRVIIPMNGRYPWMGTNPMAFAAPAEKEPPFVIDMASSTTSYGKVSIAQAFGVDIPEGWAQDANGKAVTDITRRGEAIGQPPLGGTYDQGAHKGMGIGMMADVLGGVLPGETLSGMLLDDPKGGRFCHYFHSF